MEVEVEQSGSFERLKKIALTILFSFYGDAYSNVFYLAKFGEFLEIYYDNDQVHFIMSGLDEQFIDDFRNLSSFENKLNNELKLRLNYLPLVDILSIIINANYSHRQAFVTLFSLLDKNGFEISDQFYRYFSRVFLKYINHYEGNTQSNQNIIRFVKHLQRQRSKENIVGLDVMNKKTFEVTTIPRFQSIETRTDKIHIAKKRKQLGKLLTSGKINRSIKIDLLSAQSQSSANEHLIEKASRVTGATTQQVGDFIEEIVQKIVDNNLYELFADGRVAMLGENSTQYKLLKILSENPDILSNNFLSDSQKRVIKTFLSLKTNEIYPSYTILAEELASTNAQVEQSMEASVSKIIEYLKHSKAFYLDNRGIKLKPNSGRYKLIAKIKNKDFRGMFTDKELEVIDMYMERDDRRFLYSYQDIVDCFGLASENIVEVLVRKFINRASNEGKYVNQDGRELRDQHKEAIRLIERIDEKFLPNMLSPTEISIAKELILKMNGRYRSLLLIAEVVHLDISNIKRAIRRIITKVNKYLEM